MLRRICLASAILIVAAALSALADEPAPHPGAAVFAKHCKSCHGSTGVGVAAVAAKLKAEIPDLTKPREDRDAAVAEWTKEIAEGEKKMPAYARKLTPEELKAVTEYTIASFLKPPAKDAPAKDAATK